MKKKLYSLALLALTLVVSCQNNAGTEPNPNDKIELEVSFTSEIAPNTTRVADDSFENANQIAVAALSADASSAVYAPRALYTYNASTEKFTSSSPIKYEDKDQSLKFYATYPAQDEVAEPFEFEIESDQSNESNFSSSDLLVATTGVTKDLMVNLQFEHKFTTLLVNITESDESLENINVVVRAKTLVDSNVARDSYTSKGSVVELNPFKVDEDSYKVIVAPQTIAANSALVSIQIGVKEYSLVLSDDKILDGATSYNVDVKIENGKATFDTSINDWKDEVELEDAWKLKEFSRFNYPTDTDTWVVADISATTEEFRGLYEALCAVRDKNETLADEDQRMINLSFPCMVEVPDNALFESVHVDALSSVLSIDAPKAEVIGDSAFENCENIISVNFPNVVELKAQALYCLYEIEEINLPKCEIVGNNAFGFAMSCHTVKLPVAVDIDDLVFYDMESLRTIYLSTNSKLLRFGTDGSEIGGYWVFLNTDSSVIDLYIGAQNEWLVNDNWLLGTLLFSDASPKGGADAQFNSITIVK